MTIIEAIRYMGIDGDKAKTYLQTTYQVTDPNVDITPSMIQDLGITFPNHFKRIILTITGRGIKSELVGIWSGKYIQQAQRALAQLFGKVKSAIRTGKPDVSTRTALTPEMIAQDKKERAAKVIEREIKQGIRNENGDMNWDEVAKQHLTTKPHQEASNMSGEVVVNPTNNPYVQVSAPVQPVTPGNIPKAQHDTVQHVIANEPNSGVGTGVTVVTE